MTSPIDTKALANCIENRSWEQLLDTIKSYRYVVGSDPIVATAMDHIVEALRRLKNDA